VEKRYFNHLLFERELMIKLVFLVNDKKHFKLFDLNIHRDKKRGTGIRTVHRVYKQSVSTCWHWIFSFYRAPFCIYNETFFFLKKRGKEKK